MICALGVHVTKHFLQIVKEGHFIYGSALCCFASKSVRTFRVLLRAGTFGSLHGGASVALVLLEVHRDFLADHFVQDRRADV